MKLNDFQKMILMTLKTPCREKHLFKARLANRSEDRCDKLHFGFVVGLGVGALVGIADEEISPLFAQAHGIDNIVLPEGW